MEFFNSSNISVLISTQVFIMSVLIYRRNKTIENQNHFYKYKLDSYNALLNLCYSLVNDARKEVTDFYSKFKSGKMSNEEFALKSKSLELFVEKAELDLYAKSHFFPEEVVDCIEDFIDSFFEDHFYPTTDEDFNDTLDAINSLSDNIFDIGEAMREDLGIDKLDKSLGKRLA